MKLLKDSDKHLTVFLLKSLKYFICPHLKFVNLHPMTTDLSRKRINRMIMKKVVYLHGMGSSGSSATARRLDRSLPGGYEVIAPDIPVQPEMALSMLRKLAGTLHDDDIIIGTSMGGMYAQLFKGWRRILVNPSFHTSEHLREKTGTRMPFHTPRQDGITDFEVTPKLIKKYEKMESQQFDPKFGIINKNRKDSPDLVTAFFGLHDTTVNCKEEYLQHFSRYHDFDGEHRLDPDTLINLVVPEITDAASCREH